MAQSHVKYPFCCKEDSLFFSTLLENYINLRRKYDGLKILNSDYQIYQKLAQSDIELLIKRLTEKIDKLNPDIIEQAESKYWSVASLLFIYYVKLVFETISSTFRHQEFLIFIKKESLDLNNSFGTEQIEQALYFIKMIFEDIEVYKQTSTF
ncbi:hypothetical protein [Spiroplasma culicicola]|uniref:Uncharacterized protein n=1 Tax=Spiroplasma culicicola AES-1 TaxID=1276246 RepID=W6A618_9MOLU|nr:hypothetical protein [Spiroplasma culicicola]AHI52568.1 hypothetical protein SCULI_v1c02270 [Spiroplasma culicicola AES-1]